MQDKHLLAIAKTVFACFIFLFKAVYRMRAFLGISTVTQPKSRAEELIDDYNERRLFDNRTPLHYAAAWEAVEVVIELIEKGGDVSARDNSGNTPLKEGVESATIHAKDWSVNSDYETISKIRVLIENGADVNEKNEKGIMPIHRAVDDCSVAVIQFLIKNGADINGTDQDGFTPLHCATTSRLDHTKDEQNTICEIVDLLMENGADIEAKDQEGLRPLHYAVSGALSTRGTLSTARALVDHGADVNARGDKEGLSPLHWAINSFSVEIARLLIENGADINAKDDAGWTPMQFALQWDVSDLTDLLLEKGAQIEPISTIDRENKANGPENQDIS